MIRITRGEEPARLPAARERGLDKIHRLLAEEPEHRVSSGDILSGYKCAATPLRESQGGKCCYCEKRIEGSHNDVEHYRPKTRYWWLAWDWSNLLFACRQCNQPPNKHDKFPLADGSNPLRPGESPPGDEHPLLLDPAGERDPLDSIQFRPIKIAGRTRWRPFGRDPIGHATIRVLGLDREGLLEHYNDYIKETVRDSVKKVQRAMSDGEAREVHRVWEELKRRFLRQRAAFAALAHDFIAHHIPAEKRQRWQLDLPRPPID